VLSYIYFASRSGCKVLWWIHLCVCVGLCVCLSICLQGYLQNHMCDRY